MTADRPDWTTLNAYVDGELPARDAAGVARSLAENRDLAETVAALAKLKATLLETAERPKIVLAPVSRGRRWRPAALVAAIAALVAAVALLAFPTKEPAESPWLARAWEVHRAWSPDRTSRPAVAPIDSGSTLAALVRIGPRAYLPDLSAGRLMLDHLAIVPLPEGGEVLHAGYVGNRGCRLSLVMIPGGEGLPRDLTRYDLESVRAFAWRSASHGYLLLADGMDRARLELIARTVQGASLELSPFGPETRTALRESRERSAPCAG